MSVRLTQSVLRTYSDATRDVRQATLDTIASAHAVLLTTCSLRSIERSLLAAVSAHSRCTRFSFGLSARSTRYANHVPHLGATHTPQAQVQSLRETNTQHAHDMLDHNKQQAQACRVLHRALSSLQTSALEHIHTAHAPRNRHDRVTKRVKAALID